jgi:hypothetical protein
VILQQFIHRVHPLASFEHEETRRCILACRLAGLSACVR